MGRRSRWEGNGLVGESAVKGVVATRVPLGVDEVLGQGLVW
jgi:hypothetical protein